MKCRAHKESRNGRNNVKDAYEFFRRKKPWSRYKDLILDYYLKPYLAKVSRIGKPVAVIDCFAGAGKFRDGQAGSPLIIHGRLQDLHARGISVRGVFIEKDKNLFRHLQQSVPTNSVPVTLLKGDFHKHLQMITELAKTHSVFVYLDPINPSHLEFNDLADVYAQLAKGQSVETLINFLTTPFLRGIRGVMERIIYQEKVDVSSSMATRLDQIAGGRYWRKIVEDIAIPDAQKVDQFAEQYANQLSKWFKWRITYAVRRKYADAMPKYHLIFGSRHEDAIDLMNKAMVNARRKFLGAQFVEGQLFDSTPQSESIEPPEIRAAVVMRAKVVGRTTWKLLRVHTTIANPCRYTDTEINHAIKQAIVDGFLGSTGDGNRIAEGLPIFQAAALSRECQ